MKKRIMLTVLSLMLVFLPIIFFGCDKKDSIEKISNSLNSYAITASLDDKNKTVSATEVVEIKNNKDFCFDCVFFHLHPNAFKEGNTQNFAVSELQEQKAFDGEKSYGGIEILSVKENSKEQSFSVEGVDEHILKVNTQNLAKKGDKTSIEISFLLTLPKVNHRFGYGEHSINLGNWFPILCVFDEKEWNTEGYLPVGDPFYSEVANYKISFSYDEEFVMCSTGNVISENEQNGIKTSELEAKAVRDFAVVFSKEYKTVEEQTNSALVKYYYYDDENPELHLKTAVDAINTFSELFYQYPYKTLIVCKTNFLHGGMEYPMLVYVSDQITNDSEYNNVIVHEIAHQWWYSLVGNNQLKFGFIDEGLAEFSTALFYEKNEGYFLTKDEVIGNALSSYLLYCDVFKEVYGNLNTQMNRDIKTFNSETEYVYLTYVKGLLMFDGLCDVMGEKKMIKCLKGLCEDYAFKEITPEEMIDCFEKHSHRHLRSYITSWLDGTVVLEELNGESVV